MMARQNKVTDDGYPIVHGRLSPGWAQDHKWMFKLHNYANQTVVLALTAGAFSKPFDVHDRKVLTIPCKRMGRILPGRNSHLFDV